MQVIGAGNDTCGDWFEARYRPGHERQMEWLFGYLTGFNDFYGASGDVTAGHAKYEIEYMVDEFCLRHPLSTLLEATRSLIQTMEQARQ